MKNEKANNLLERLEHDDTIQNLIAQGDSRYILFNVQEPMDNFPNYTTGLDESLTSAALSYLSIGCSFAENGNLEKAIFPLEKGATILENVHSPSENRNQYSSYFILAGSLAFYAAHQYSKSFILLKNVEMDTDIAKLIAYFLKRNYIQLGKFLSVILISDDYTDDKISKLKDVDIANNRIYTLILSKALSTLLEFIYSGNEEWFEKTKEYLNDLLVLLSIDVEPSLWWVVRLFRIIIDGFQYNSLWKTIPPLLGNVDNLVKNYILSMAFQKNPIVELFLSQKVALPKVLNPSGAVVSLPTSGGKTRVAEIAILQSLINDPEGMVLYLAPFRSLAFEVEESLSRTFRSLGFEVSQLYGGSQFSKLDEMVINESRIIIATAEKAKAIVRSNSEIKSKIKLVVVDEGHLLGPEERFVASEIFIEELRTHINKNEGKIILLSAVLPNADEIAKWISGNDQMSVDSKWRPSTQRFGLLEYNSKNVNITWKGDIESFNRNFINPFTVKRKRSIYQFPKDKKQAIGAAAVKLSLSGSILIFVCRKNMVLSQAREVLQAMGDNPEEHLWSSEFEWNAFKFACEEAYGEDSEVFQLAKYGILCHYAGLSTEVRLSIEKLMRKGNPKIIVATSTLGQGVNLGVSTVIIANVWYDNEKKIKSNEFWNIVGRAGRSFVDREGKILFVVDASRGTKKARADRSLALEYFDNSKQEKAVSGLLHIVNYIYRVAIASKLEFDTLLQLIAENDYSLLNEKFSKMFTRLFDWIDDTLLSLNQEFESYKAEDESAWIDDYFRQSLAYIQAKHFGRFEGEEVILFLKSRNKGVLKLAGDPKNWSGYVSSSIPLQSGLFIKQEISNILEIVYRYQTSGRSTEDLIIFLKETENIVSKFPSEQFKENGVLPALDKIRELWINGESISSIDEKVMKDYNQYFTFTLPWGINAIARMLSTMEMEDEAKEFEELAVLVQMGLPNMFAANIYLTGIQSRIAATELSSVLEPMLQELSVRNLRNQIINNSDSITNVTEKTAKWLLILKGRESDVLEYTERISNFTFKDDISVKSQSLSVKKYGEEYYLCSPDFDNKLKIQTSKQFPFDKFADDFSVNFEYTNTGQWTMQIRNPYLKFNYLDFLDVD